jgi:hypothetical protein
VRCAERIFIAAAAALSYGISAVIFRRQTAADAPRTERVTIRAGGRTECVQLLCDSGNLLTDPLTGRPALILTKQSAQRLFPEAVNDAQIGRIPFDSLGGSGWLEAFQPEEIRREDGSQYEAVIALTTAFLGADCDGLIAQERRNHAEHLESIDGETASVADSMRHPAEQ